MKKLVNIFLLAFSIVALTSCSQVIEEGGYLETSRSIEGENVEKVSDVEKVAAPDIPLTHKQELFLEDLDYILYVLENNFALFDVAYWARSADITAIFENMREIVLENPEIDVDEFYNILAFNSFPAIAHFRIMSPVRHQPLAVAPLLPSVCPIAHERLRLDHVLAFYEPRHPVGARRWLPGRTNEETMSVIFGGLSNGRYEFLELYLNRFYFLGERERVEQIRIAVADGNYEQAEILVAEVFDNIGRIPNITTSVIEEGRIVGLVLNSFITRTWDEDMAQILEFLQEIRHYEHLIIDLRANPGGIPQHFFESVMRPIISETHFAEGFAFFDYDGTYVQENIGSGTEMFWRQYQIDPRVGQSMQTLYEILDEFYLPDFNHDDTHRLSHGFRLSVTVRRARRWVPVFDGKIWMLTSPATRSGAQIVSWVAKDSGFATLVGETSGGNYGGPRTFVALPNSGIIFEMDVFYVTDRYGFPLEAGTRPHYFNREGMDALETALALIEEGAYR